MPEVRRFFKGTIILSGSITTGRAMLAAQAVGADLAYMGTRFIATAEANAPAGYKQMLIDTAAADIVYTSLFSGMLGNYLKPSVARAGLDPENLPGADKSKMNFAGRETRGQGVARHLGRGAGRRQHRRRAAGGGRGRAPRSRISRRARGVGLGDRRCCSSQAIAAYAHYLSIFCTVALLVAEFALFRQRMEAGTVRLLPRLDLFYLVAVIAIIVTGLLRVYFFAKGVAFYRGNEMFWIKMALFVVVGLLSLPPTFAFIANRQGGGGAGARSRARQVPPHPLFHVAELAVFALIPLAAALMARGLAL